MLRGELSPRKALTLPPVALGGDEASWVERARSQLAETMKAEGGDEEEETWERIHLSLSAEQRATVDLAADLAGKVVGVPASRHQCLEAMAQEYLGEHGDEGSEAGGEAMDGGGAGREAIDADAAGCQAGPGAGLEADGAIRPAAWGPPRDRAFSCGEVESWLEAVKKLLEIETGCWEALARVDPVEAPRAGEEASPRAIDAELRRLAGMLARWDELVGHLALVMKVFGLRKEAGFADFDHYCVERLWMAPRTVKQRVWLERRFYDLPGLREAMRSGRLSYEQVRLVAAVAVPETLADWIRRAAGMSCIALRRAVEGQEEEQMCARGKLSVRVPSRVAEVMGAAFRAARRKAGRHSFAFSVTSMDGKRSVILSSAA